MAFIITSELQKLDNQISFIKSQLRGWETFYSEVHDPNNILLAKNEIAINTKTLSDLEAKRLNLTNTNTQNPR